MMVQPGTMVSFPSSTVQREAYIVHPAGEGLFPSIVIIHEAYGLNENIKEIAHRFAEIGYIALAVDLFAGRNRAICMFRFMGGMLFNSFEHEGIHDLKAALTFLTQQPGVYAEKF